MLIRSLTLALLSLASIALGCGASAPRATPTTLTTAEQPVEERDEEPAAEPAPDMTVYWANVALVGERYCQPMAALSARVLDACGCSEDERAGEFLATDELAASCTYHLVALIPEDRAMTVNEAALAACMAALEASLTGCAEARLPPACELARLFDPAPGVLSYSRPEGRDCRAENGDEGFDAHFLCAEGLTCAGTCTSAAIPDPTYREGPCRSPLWLPPAIP